LFDYDDAISLALVTAWKACETWDGSRSSFDTHVITRVRGALLDVLRLRRYGAKSSRAGAEFAVSVSLESVIYNKSHDGERELKVADALADPRDEVAACLSRLECDSVLPVLRWLPPKEAAVLRGYYLEDVTLKTIAGRLRLSESRVHQLHAQALKRARQMLGGQLG
jgi:RNA polymerase sigma factor for flagellar operon FliA